MTNENYQVREAALGSRGLMLTNSRRLGEVKALFVQRCGLDSEGIEAWYTLGNINGMLTCRRVHIAASGMAMGIKNDRE